MSEKYHPFYGFERKTQYEKKGSCISVMALVRRLTSVYHYIKADIITCSLQSQFTLEFHQEKWANLQCIERIHTVAYSEIYIMFEDLSEVTVYMSDMLPLVVDPADPMLTYCTTVKSSNGVGEAAILACMTAESGRYIIVASSTSIQLTLCNVKAFGHPASK